MQLCFRKTDRKKHMASFFVSVPGSPLESKSAPSYSPYDCLSEQQSILANMLPIDLCCSSFLFLFILRKREKEREREREKENKCGEGAEREGQKIQSRLCADSREPDVGLELMNHEIMT